MGMKLPGFFFALLAILAGGAAIAQQNWGTYGLERGASHSVKIGSCEYPGDSVGDYGFSYPTGDGRVVYLTFQQFDRMQFGSPKTDLSRLCRQVPGPSFKVDDQRATSIGVPVDLDALLDNPRALSTPPPTRVAPVSSLPHSPPTQVTTQQLNRQLDEVIARDARSWLVNRYNLGSARDARIEESNAQTGRMVVFGRYTFNGSATGWIRVVFSGSTPQCVEYHDFQGTCRAVGNNPSHYVALGALAVAAVGAAASSGSGGSTGPASSYDQCVARCNSSGYANDPGRDAAFRQNCIRQCR